MKTKEINIHNIQKMQAALQSIREHLGLAGKASRVNIGESEGTSWLGITLSPSSHGDLLNCGTKASVGWFGWEQLPEEDTAPCAGVWIYFDSKASARKALGCVKGAESWKQEDAALCLRKACSTLAEDNDWFKERVAEVMAAFKAKTFRWSMT